MAKRKRKPWHDLTGQLFGRWRVTARSTTNCYGEVLWDCTCSCGTRKDVVARTLVEGKSQSCGCTSKDWCRTHGMEGTPTYNVWAAMIQRCENKNAQWYHRYGMRGISVCPEWRNNFAAFYADMGEKPKGMSLGRINNDGNYEPSNCRWETTKQQMRNRHTTIWLEYNGERKPLPEWAEQFGLKRKVLTNRISAGWPIHEALTIKRANAWNGPRARTH